MLKFLEHADLSHDALLATGFHQVEFFINFDRQHEPSLDVHRLLDRCIGALPEVLHDLVVRYLGVIAGVVLAAGCLVLPLHRDYLVHHLHLNLLDVVQGRTINLASCRGESVACGRHSAHIVVDRCDVVGLRSKRASVANRALIPRLLPLLRLARGVGRSSTTCNFLLFCSLAIKTR